MTPAERKEKEEADKLAAFIERRRRDDFLAIMGTQAGRRFVWGLMGDSGMFRGMYSPDHSEMAFREGKRQAGLKLLDDCNNICPLLYLKMMDENNQPIEVDDQ